MDQSLFDFQPARNTYSVSALTREIQGLLESKFLDVWVEGEISNLRVAASGHYYFTLKDARAQIRAVCFRNQARYLKLKPQDGVSVIVRGRLTVYETRGEYQILVELIEPAGLGALQLAFEQLKAKLAAEGLFDTARKKPLPVLPRTVGVVTSPSGAVIRDIVRVLRRRFRNMNLLLYPVKVQGEGAAAEIAEAIRFFNRRAAGDDAGSAPVRPAPPTRSTPQMAPVDVILVARGGGSLEDLWAFNEEPVARAIAASKIPIISAVGHETDFTIADFVADLRAPTPSAAAELVVHRKEDFEAELEERERRMGHMLRLKVSEARQRLTELRMHRVFQTLAARLAERAQQVDDLMTDLDRSLRQRLATARHELLRGSAGVLRFDFPRLLGMKRAVLDEREKKVDSEFQRCLSARRDKLGRVESLLHERSPLVILARGYSITRDTAGKIIRDSSQVAIGAAISVRLARGELDALVREKK
ncbi:MAG: exodeoxyribonuclease VII large subunit [Terriglobia bacterium]